MEYRDRCNGGECFTTILTKYSLGLLNGEMEVLIKKHLEERQKCRDYVSFATIMSFE